MSAAAYDTVSFLSDYGTTDETAGVVRAVIADLAPHARVIDITHGIAPFDVRAGSLSLARAIAYLPRGVVIAAIDPDAGRQRAIAVEVGDGAGVLIGPDNGVLAPAVALAGGAGRAVSLADDAYHLGAASGTQRGRDVFAPVAAHLCNGVDLADFGPAVDPHTLMPGVVPLPRDEGDEIICEVLWVDHFGNVQLNVGPDDVARFGGRLSIRVGEVERVATLGSSFADFSPGAVGLLADGAGLLALVLARRSAADEMSASAGDQVIVRPVDGAVAGHGVTSPVTMRPR